MFTTSSKSQLRCQLRDKRRKVTPSLQAETSQQIIRNIMQLPIFQTSEHIAIYMPFEQEIDVTPLLTMHPEKRFYLPVVNQERLLFAHFKTGQSLAPNELGILEPQERHYLSAVELDLVCLPLVGFDTEGHRIGTGAGFYDKTFAFKQGGREKPWLLGIAYDWQKIPVFQNDPWDIPLWGIQTECQLYRSTGML